MSLYAVAFKNVGINRTLCKEVNAVELSCFFNENVYKLVADNFSLCFGVLNTCEFIEETVDSININEVCVHLVLKYSDNLFGLALTEKSVVYVYANKLLADSLYKKCGYNR